MTAFLTIALIHLLAVMSPGPDFALCTRNSLIYSRRTGIFTAIGFALGILVHVSYCLLGIGLIIARSILLFNMIKCLGAGYLLFIGCKALMHKSSAGSLREASRIKHDDLSPLTSLRMGFLCNVLNPKVTLFFLALFTQVINPHTPLSIKMLYGLVMSLQTFLWFSFVATVLSLAALKRRFERIQGIVERSMGAILIALGLRVALATRE